MRRRAFLKACLGAAIACAVPGRVSDWGPVVVTQPKPLTFDVIQEAVGNLVAKGQTLDQSYSLVVHPDTWPGILGDLRGSRKIRVDHGPVWL